MQLRSPAQTEPRLESDQLVSPLSPRLVSTSPGASFILWLATFLLGGNTVVASSCDLRFWLKSSETFSLLVDVVCQ